MIRVWIIEDNPSYRASLVRLLQSASEIDPELAFASCEAALTALRTEEPPDVFLVDLGLKGMSGVEGIREIRRLELDSKMIVLTVHATDEKVISAVAAGASGYLLKPSSREEIVTGIEGVVGGISPINGYIARKILEAFSRVAPQQEQHKGYGLTPREQEFLILLVRGLTVRQCAQELGVSYNTANTHIRHIYDKLHVKSRGRVVAKAISESLI